MVHQMDLSLALLLLLACLASSAVGQQSMVPQVAVQSGKNATYFILTHVRKKPGGVNTAEESILFSQSGSASAVGANSVADMLAEGDACDPRPTTVDMPLNTSDLRAFYFPTCTRVRRCGGCCGSDLTECAPIQTSTTLIKVMKCRYPENGASDIFEFEGLVDIPMEVHTACECRCRIQAYHCDPVKHVYNADTCKCQCRNQQMATQCPSNKHWDEKECTCVCPRIPNCLSDEFFNFNTCSCQQGSLSSGSSQPSVNPCATANIRCRPGWALVAQSDGRCVCRPGSRRRRRHLAITK